MDYAVTKLKKPSSGWLKVRVRQRKAPRASQAVPARQNTGRRAAQLKEKIRTGTRWLLRGLLAAGLAWGAWQTALFLTTSPRFAVSRITVTGNEQVKNEDLRNWLNSVSGKNVFMLDLEEVSRDFETHPWVQSASVRKVFPATLHIHLVERSPFARIQIGETYVMDSRGVLLTGDAPEYGHLPLVVHSGEGAARPGQTVASRNVVESLKVMRSLNRLPFFRDDDIASARIRTGARVEFTTRKAGTQVLMSLDALRRNFRNFRMLMNTLDKEGKAIDRIDLSFRDQVVVRYKKG